VTTPPTAEIWEKDYKKYAHKLGTQMFDIPLQYTLFNTEPDPEVWEQTYFNYYTAIPDTSPTQYAKVKRVLDGSPIPAWEADTYYEAHPHDVNDYFDPDELYLVKNNNRIMVDEENILMLEYESHHQYKQRQLLYSNNKVYLVIAQTFVATTIADDITAGYIIDISGGSEIATALTTLAGRVDDLERRIAAIEPPSEP
jgi:hypothetical protein